MLCSNHINFEHGIILSLFLAGIIGGFTHCVAMCGPFVLMQNKNNWGNNNKFEYKKLVNYALIPYHLGRMTTYVAMAVLLNTVLNIVFITMPIKSYIIAPILFLTGIIFLANAFPKLSLIAPWAIKFRMPISSRLFERMIRPYLSANTTLQQYILGLILGLMPCGLVMAALMTSSMAETPFNAALAMSAFAVGTVPSLIMLSTGGQFLQKKYPKKFSHMQNIMMMISGIWLCILAGVIIF